MNKEQKQKIADLLRYQKMGVVSTVSSEGFPESAWVALSETEDLEIIFGTSRLSRKFENLQTNKRIAVVVYNEQQRQTLQYEGEVMELHGDEKTSAQEIHLLKHPAAKKYSHDIHQSFFKVKPLWIRYTDYHLDPHEIFEVKF